MKGHCGDGLIYEYTLPAQEVARPITDKHTVRCKYKSTGWDGAYLATSREPQMRDIVIRLYAARVFVVV